MKSSNLKSRSFLSIYSSSEAIVLLHISSLLRKILTCLILGTIPPSFDMNSTLVLGANNANVPNFMSS